MLKYYIASFLIFFVTTLHPTIMRTTKVENKWNKKVISYGDIHKPDLNVIDSQIQHIRSKGNEHV